MRRSADILLAALLLGGDATAAGAAERALIIRAGDLLAQPFIDAASTGKLAPAQPVTIVERRGPWVNVQAAGKTGWVRLLNVRLEPVAGIAGPAKPAAKPNGLTSLLRTGSSGRTVTTGVKGMDEEDIKNSTPNYTELTMLENLGVDAATARADAAKAKRVERPVDYLDKKRDK